MKVGLLIKLAVKVSQKRHVMIPMLEGRALHQLCKYVRQKWRLKQMTQMFDNMFLRMVGK